MINPPKPLPESGRHATLFRWLNQLRLYVISITPRPSKDILVKRGSRGTTYVGKAGGGRQSTTGDERAVWL